MERFRFFKNSSQCEKCLGKLGVWNQRLEKLILQAEERSICAIQEAINPSPSLRSLFTSLYATFEKHRHCSCPEEHELKIHLEHFQDKGSTDMTIDITFVLSAGSGDCSRKRCRWQEGSLIASLSR